MTKKPKSSFIKLGISLIIGCLALALAPTLAAENLTAPQDHHEEACPDCKDGQVCEKCETKAAHKACPDCKDGQVCEKCEAKAAHKAHGEHGDDDNYGHHKGHHEEGDHDLSREEHIDRAIDHLHAAGLHDIAEHALQAIHGHMGEGRPGFRVMQGRIGQMQQMHQRMGMARGMGMRMGPPMQMEIIEEEDIERHHEFEEELEHQHAQLREQHEQMEMQRREMEEQLERERHHMAEQLERERNEMRMHFEREMQEAQRRREMEEFAGQVKRHQQELAERVERLEKALMGMREFIGEHMSRPDGPPRRPNPSVDIRPEVRRPNNGKAAPQGRSGRPGASIAPLPAPR